MVRRFGHAVNEADRLYWRLAGRNSESWLRRLAPEAVPAVRNRTMHNPRQNNARLQHWFHNQKMEEAMNIDRRQLALPALALGLLGIVPAFAGADEDALAKN